MALLDSYLPLGSPRLPQGIGEHELGGVVVTGSQVRPAEELLTALRKGSTLIKYGRRGKPKTHHFRLSADDRELIWDSNKGKIRRIPLSSVIRVCQGQDSPVFRRSPEPGLVPLSFSLYYQEKGNKERTLDVICKTQMEFEDWYLGIQLVVLYLAQSQTPGYASPQSSLATTQLSKAPSLGQLEELTKADSMKSSINGTSVIGGGTVPGRVSGMLGFPAKREIGDCYIWGSLTPLHLTVRTDPLKDWQESSWPVMVQNTTALDICKVSCGPSHAALVTRGGEVYTWGNGTTGCLGHGICQHSGSPQQVVRLFRKGIKAVSCGNTCTLALGSDGTVYSWGLSLAGQLGHGDTWAYFWPTRIGGSLEGIRIDHISCGPYHTAAVSQEGLLFTWGDGVFGKLGHGSHQSFLSPKIVESLVSCWVLDASCGSWHTAAVAVSREAISQQGSEPPTCTSSATGSQVGSVLQGGSLYTWGGDFTWREPAKLKGESPVLRDHHRGSLGLGDLRGRLVPCVVGGALIHEEVKQVACGASFTVVLTLHGRVYQMGSTGAFNPHEKCVWEGAKVPTLVGGCLENVYAEEVACGIQHIAVVGSQCRPDGSIMEFRTRLFTWGKGNLGQLGLGPESVPDHAAPQLCLDGRKILHIACGGYQTLAVAEHDPREAALTSGRDADEFAKLMGRPRASPGPYSSGPLSPSGSLPPSVKSTSMRSIGAAARDLDPNMVSLTQMSAQSKRSRLAKMGRTFNLGQTSRNSSRAESVSSANSDRASRRNLPPAPSKGHGYASGSVTQRVLNTSTSQEDLRRSFSRQSSLSAASVQVSNSSITEYSSLKMSQSTTDFGTLDSAGATNSGLAQHSDPEMASQLRYWRERASHLENQLSRRMLEMESIKHGVGSSQSLVDLTYHPTSPTQSSDLGTSSYPATPLPSPARTNPTPSTTGQQSTPARRRTTEDDVDLPLTRGISLGNWARGGQGRTTSDGSPLPIVPLPTIRSPEQSPSFRHIKESISSPEPSPGQPAVDSTANNGLGVEFTHCGESLGSGSNVSTPKVHFQATPDSTPTPLEHQLAGPPPRVHFNTALREISFKVREPILEHQESVSLGWGKADTTVPINSQDSNVSERGRSESTSESRGGKLGYSSGAKGLPPRKYPVLDDKATGALHPEANGVAGTHSLRVNLANNKLPEAYLHRTLSAETYSSSEGVGSLSRNASPTKAQGEPIVEECRHSGLAGHSAKVFSGEGEVPSSTVAGLAGPRESQEYEYGPGPSRGATSGSRSPAGRSGTYMTDLLRVQEENMLLRKQLEEWQARVAALEQKSRLTETFASDPGETRDNMGSMVPASPRRANRHRRALSVDIGATLKKPLYQEVEPGVVLVLEQGEGGAMVPTRVRFDRQVVAEEEAKEWLASKKWQTAGGSTTPPVPGAPTGPPGAAGHTKLVSPFEILHTPMPSAGGRGAPSSFTGFKSLLSVTEAQGNDYMEVDLRGTGTGVDPGQHTPGDSPTLPLRSPLTRIPPAALNTNTVGPVPEVVSPNAYCLHAGSSDVSDVSGSPRTGRYSLAEEGSSSTLEPGPSQATSSGSPPKAVKRGSSKNTSKKFWFRP